MTEKQKKFSLRTIFRMFVLVVAVPFLPLLISRKWEWWEAWLYGIICVMGFVISRVIAGRRNPGLLSERAQFLQHADAKAWDKLLAPLVGLGGGLIPLTAGLEAALGSPTPFSLPWKIFAIFLLLAGYALGAYALIENRFFSGMVRIQTDRGHQVVSSGPYRWVRHPGYAGALVSYLAAPVLLDSLWAFVPAVFLLIVLIIRTRLEDITLQAELGGYQAYSERVRYRLLPWIW